MLAPERVTHMAKEMQRHVLERLHKAEQQSAEKPRESQALDARITRLKKRLAEGDPDMTPDELQVAIDRVQHKRQELEEITPAKNSEIAKLVNILPNAAELYRRQITLGLDGTRPHLRQKARLVLRELLGQIRLEPEAGGSLWAAYEIQPTVIVRAAVSGLAG